MADPAVQFNALDKSVLLEYLRGIQDAFEHGELVDEREVQMLTELGLMERCEGDEYEHLVPRQADFYCDFTDAARGLLELVRLAKDGVDPRAALIGGE